MYILHLTVVIFKLRMKSQREIWIIKKKKPTYIYIYWRNRRENPNGAHLLEWLKIPNNGDAAGWQIRWMFYAQNEKLMRNRGKKNAYKWHPVRFRWAHFRHVHRLPSPICVLLEHSGYHSASVFTCYWQRGMNKHTDQTCYITVSEWHCHPE